MRKRITKYTVYSFLGLFILLNGMIGQPLADEIKIEIPIWTDPVTEDTVANPFNVVLHFHCN